MKKKLIAAILAVTLLIAGCGNINVSEEHGEKLMLVESGGGYGILADKDTGVMYLFIENGGGITVMLNTDGTPKIWQGKE